MTDEQNNNQQGAASQDVETLMAMLQAAEEEGLNAFGAALNSIALFEVLASNILNAANHIEAALEEITAKHDAAINSETSEPRGIDPSWKEGIEQINAAVVEGLIRLSGHPVSTSDDLDYLPIPRSHPQQGPLSGPAFVQTLKGLDVSELRELYQSVVDYDRENAGGNRLWRQSR